MNVPGDLKYTKTHEWVRASGGEAVVGVTDFAQHELGDIVFVEAPEAGAAVTAGSPMGSVESVKAVSELNAPVSGTVSAANDALKDHPELLNQDPYGEGWIVKIALSDAAEIGGLMDAEAYGKYVAEASH
ncbi:MAG: glycine cleavage system protein GcvH [Acidobacteriota bacterium]